MKLLFGLLFVFGCASSSKPKITTCEQFKQQVLGIGAERYCQLPAFRGHPTGDESEVIQTLHAFLRSFRTAQ